MKNFYKLILITDRRNTHLDEYLKFLEICANAGITAVQLREKNSNLKFILEFGIKLKNILSPFNIPLIINDHIHLALELNADGVHLGQADGDPKLARKILGPNKIIGVSAYSQKQVGVANSLPLDYVGVGAVFKTKSKKDVAAILGIKKFREILSKSKYPAIGIGGIDEENAAAVMTAGASGVAIIHAVHSAQNPAKIIQKLRAIVDKKGADYVI